VTEIQLFEVEGSRWRFGQDDDDRPWVVAADVAASFGYRTAAEATRLLDEDENRTQIVRTLGGDQRMSVLYEDGLWELIFLSRRPEAKAIKKRVKEILQEIRRTGSYEVASMTPAELLLAQAQRLVEQERQVRQLNVGLAEVSARIDGIEQRTGWFTALAFARLNGLPTDRRSLQLLGIAATKAARAAGVEPVKTQNEVYGELNCYPKWALAKAAGGRA
jgi:prophage antirepressor-like protein